MKIICIGRNYQKHAAELGNEVPSEPVVFLKPDTALIRKNEDFYIPDFSSDIHYECELVVRISRVGKNIKPEFAHKYYNQISLGIDFTARDLQSDLKKKGLPWERAKSFDRAAVIGELKNAEDYQLTDTNFQLKVNDEVRQTGSTSDMIFSVDQIIAEISSFITLKVGDLIYTGTPEGVGKVSEGDVLVGLLEGEEVFRTRVR
jgi:2-keto-4-pentenoate hydratase/2-oxohepta-3-ene-1,7-dioic acid hydratase in catechol pathway